MFQFYAHAMKGFGVLAFRAHESVLEDSGPESARVCMSIESICICMELKAMTEMPGSLRRATNPQIFKLSISHGIPTSKPE